MAVPKRKTSPSRRGMRRSHDALRAPTYHACDHCGESVIPHHMCPNCGYYRQRAILTRRTSKEATT